MAKIFDYEIFTGSRKELIDIILNHIQNNRLMSLLSMNTLKLHLGDKDEKYKKIFKSFTHIMQDGQSIVFANRLVNGIKSESISGAELMVDLIGISDKKNLKVFFLGAPQELLDRVKDKIKNDYPSLLNNTEYQNGYYNVQNEDVVINKIATFGPDFLFIAFGSPRKEEFIIKYQDKLNTKVLMGVGGSYEYFVGDVKLDKTTKKLGLRWLVRTLQDPFRLGRRYMVCNSYYFKLLMKELWRKLFKK
jgi:exopolysaccharide biosynthesis WecB/TagA/CpsF family protein